MSLYLCRAYVCLFDSFAKHHIYGNILATHVMQLAQPALGDQNHEQFMC